VVFHHGVGASLEIFDEWVPIVAARHPVVRYDMRGFGQSIVPPATHEWTMSELVEDLLEVGEVAFGTEPIHVMGESIGGTIALAASLRHPERFSAVAMSNAAINGGHIGYAPGWRSEVARIGIDGWSKRLMEMRFVPGAAPPEAVAIIESVPKWDERIFPYVSESIGTSFTRACKLLGITGLHFHDLRHEGVSLLFEKGATIPQAATVSGHRTWQSLKRYSHLRQVGDKYAGWKWHRIA
jgi:pimeloyl-ACP methyl ester carboxylesterase